MTRHDEIIKFIQIIRESFIGSEVVYTRGSCYRFYQILKDRFPESEAYSDIDHVITKIDDRYYDISGEVPKGRHEPIDPAFEMRQKRHKFVVDIAASLKINCL